MIKRFFILSSDVLHLVTKTTLPYKGHRSSRGHCGVTAGPPGALPGRGAAARRARRGACAGRGRGGAPPERTPSRGTPR